jgi:nicotinamide-nucleotide adenylyltransferase
MKALLLGRFQPFHLGHLSELREVDGMKDKLSLEKIIIGIGTNGGVDKRHPFDYETIKEMIMPEAQKLRIEVVFYRIPDINDPANYAKHVEKITGCTENDTLIVSGNVYTLACFTDHDRKYQTYTQKKAIVHGIAINATAVREMMVCDDNWKEYVPESTVKVIEKINGTEKLKQFYR